MLFYKWLGKKIEGSVRKAYQGSLPDTSGGCMPVAFDGLVCGALDPSVYREHLETGTANGANRLFFVVETTRAIERGSSLLGSDYYSSSARLFSRAGLLGGGRPLCRREAEKMVRRIRSEQNFGVLVASFPKGSNEGHLFSLIGQDGSIIRVDGCKMSSLTACLSNRKAVLALRRAQRGGLVVEVGRIRGRE